MNNKHTHLIEPQVVGNNPVGDLPAAPAPTGPASGSVLRPVHIPHDFHYEGRPIVMIEYHQHGKLWMPHEVFVSHAPKHSNYCSHFDFNWCKRDGALLYHEAGSGPGAYLNGWPNAKRVHAKLWWNHELGAALRQGSGEPVTDFRALGFDLLTHPVKLGGTDQNPFEYGSEGGVVYCTKCNDHLPEANVCSHIFWCERCNEWGGSEGNKERCRHRKPQD